MAAVVGPFEGFHKNREPMLRVMQMHRDAVEQINPAGPAYLKDAARKVWDQMKQNYSQQGEDRIWALLAAKKAYELKEE